LPDKSTEKQVAGENERNMKGGPRMPTFRFNSEKPYFQEGRLVKKVKTQHNIDLSTFDCAIVGFSVARLLGKLAVALIFKRNPYRLP
jgi:hypothetical protein